MHNTESRVFADTQTLPTSHKLADVEQQKPLIDILMATYNGEQYIREQIESIQCQSFTAWRLLISDDCSSDNTPNIIQKFAEQDSRIYIVSDGIRHGSAKANFMSLMAKSKAPYVMFCDQDDVWLPTKIEKTYIRMRELEKSSDKNIPLLVFTDMKVVREDLSVISNSFVKFSNINPHRTKFPQLIAQSVGAGCTMMVNRIVVDYALKAKTNDGMIMHDWWISLIASAFGKIAYINESTSLYRQHGDNTVGAKRYSRTFNHNKIEAMQMSVQNTIIQAGLFKTVFSDSNKRTIDLYIEAYKRRSLRMLFNSKCWKNGLRKLGQMLICIIGINL